MLLPIALALLPLNIYVVQALLTTIVVISSYLSHRSFSFGAGRRTGRPSASTEEPPVVSEE
jgi:hypothetical protein